MKKIWIIALGILTISSAFVLYPRTDEVFDLVDEVESTTDEKIEWTDWNTGFERARKEGKMAIIDCYTDWCGWCKVMDKKTFTDPNVIKNINEHFVAIKFNPELKKRYLIGGDSLSGRGLLKQLARDKFGGYPTIFVYIPQNAKMFQHPGYQEAVAFSDMLDQYIEYQKGLTSK